MMNLVCLLRTAAAGLAGMVLLQGWSGTALGMENGGTTLTVMTRNVDAATDLGYLFAAADENSYAHGMMSTLAELKSSNFKQRAARLAEEIKAAAPDLIGLQEVTLWRTGPMLSPPATQVLYDQLDLLLTELAQRNLHYEVIAVQTEVDAEAPVPNIGIDLRMTDRDVVLARQDLPQSQFKVLRAEFQQFAAVYSFGNPVLGQLQVPCGWIAVNVAVNGKQLRFINTHLQGTVPGDQSATEVQRAQGDELIGIIGRAKSPVVLAGDFNSNAELGPEYTGTVQRLIESGLTDTWAVAHPGDPGYTWPLFGEDQRSGPTTPNERIDLILSTGTASGGNPAVVSAEQIGTAPPYASDHAGLVVKLRLP